MKRALLDYLKELEESKNIDEERLLKNIEIFQHERLIHLIVTVFVGISTLILLGLGITSELLGFIIVSLITLVLSLDHLVVTLVLRGVTLADSLTFSPILI